jgi:CRISPR-associated protein Cas1
MKPLLNTLYVTTEGAWCRKDGANVVVECEGAEIGRVPVHLLDGLVCIGRVGLSPPLLGFCADSGVAVTFLTEHGRFLARMVGPVSGNVLLRRAQHGATVDPTRAFGVAAAVVAAKASNQRTVIARALRDHGAEMDETHRSALRTAEHELGRAARRVLAVDELDIVRGIEGDSARSYFRVFDRLILVRDPALAFKGRSRRPPLDAPNAILSFLYSVLAHDCRSAVEAVGLDPQMGFLHRDRPGRASLALDLMEEFRAPLADRVALTVMNRGQVGERDFLFDPTGAVTLREEGRKTVLVEYQRRKQTEITHPFLGEKMPLGLAPQIQAQLLARHLRGELTGYPSFFWK